MPNFSWSNAVPSALLKSDNLNWDDSKTYEQKNTFDKNPKIEFQPLKKI